MRKFIYIFFILNFISIAYGNSYSLLKTKADAYLELNDYDNALKYYLKTLKINPSNDIIYNRIGFIYYKTAKFYKAIPYFKKAIILNTNQAIYYNNLGSVYLKLKDYKEAEKNFSYAIRKKEKYTKALYNAAVTYFYQRKYNKSLSFLFKAIKIDKKYVKKRFNKKKSLKEIKQMREKYPNDKELEKIEKYLKDIQI